jgi:hypothetical protein
VEGSAKPLASSISTDLAPTAAERTDDQAELIRHFDPVDLSLEQIETLQRLLSAAAASRRALEHSPECDPAVPYLPASEVRNLLETGVSEDDTGTYHRGGEAEIDWRNLDEPGLVHQAEIDAVIAAMKAEAAAAKPSAHPEPPRCGAMGRGTVSRSEMVEGPAPQRPNPPAERKAKQL